MSREKLRLAFRTALALPATEVVDDARYGDTEGWDSVAHMALVAEIEGAFDVMLDTDQVVSMSSFEKAAEILRGHGVTIEP